MGRWTLDTSPLYLAMDMTSRVFSPYNLNPFGHNPLRAILAKSIDFERLARSPVRLFVTATSVRTGRGHIFSQFGDHSRRSFSWHPRVCRRCFRPLK